MPWGRTGRTGIVTRAKTRPSPTSSKASSRVSLVWFRTSTAVALRVEEGDRELPADGPDDEVGHPFPEGDGHAEEPVPVEVASEPGAVHEEGVETATLHQHGPRARRDVGAVGPSAPEQRVRDAPVRFAHGRLGELGREFGVSGHREEHRVLDEEQPPPAPLVGGDPPVGGLLGGLERGDRGKKGEKRDDECSVDHGEKMGYGPISS